MISNGRILGAVLASVGACFLVGYVERGRKQHKRVTKKMAKQAVHAWEGEGGNINEAAPRVTPG